VVVVVDTGAVRVHAVVRQVHRWWCSCWEDDPSWFWFLLLLLLATDTSANTDRSVPAIGHPEQYASIFLW